MNTLDLSGLHSMVQTDIAQARRDGVTLFGAGGFARAVHSALNVAGIAVRAFVVSRAGRESIDGIPVVEFDHLDPKFTRLPMWVAVFNRESESDLSAIARACISRGIKDVRFPQDYYELIQAELGWRYWLSDRRGYVERKAQFEAAFSLLSDDQSRRQYEQALWFRAAPGRGPVPAPSPECQYFPTHVTAALEHKTGGVVFIDGGAYDGETVLKADSKLDLKSAFAFEPSRDNFERLVAKTNSLSRPCVCIPCGLSDRAESLAFGGVGEAAAISVQGTSHVQCVSVDQCLGTQRVDFIKLDVEGHELAALQGAIEVIRRDRPILAVSAYHRWDDLWRIPEFIVQNCSRYRLTYRAHAHNTFDGVFYAIPC